MTERQSVYDTENFFELYQRLRANPVSLNNIVEKPTMLSLLPDLTGKKLLDLACGTGEHLRLYLERGADFVTGMDLSAAMLRQAEKNLADFRPHFTLYQASMEDFSQLAESEFDVITSSFAFHYVQDFPKLLRAVATKLKPQGTLVFSQEHPIVTAYKGGERWEKNAQKEQVAYRLNFYRDEGERNRNWFKQPFKTYHRTTATIINNLIEAGFVIESIREPMLAEQPEWQAEFKDLQHRPVLFFVKVRKKLSRIRKNL
ncbi:class I SAM-dependent methyltransferase [Actinobacillus succinogenes]|uniref:Methyltransferase type 11 n=1 Tax=Actinobacillus succinogenes (strain ATCC 55618 / DSM 22257 / CCUG 43843 / 130Z) TaxID=339671 RepID=A6VM06_ACTSZ|nr:class I SAM-dependent methyltransferase [Actinobacillus succinogenes]ABR74003.1 Methyltransferase type 11 [Actinobacillus succinogenes 130Z]PHI39556.1 class I SAM-dependent methyltransferase [Actinobacillus succinogenes]